MLIHERYSLFDPEETPNTPRETQSSHQLIPNIRSFLTGQVSSGLLCFVAFVDGLLRRIAGTTQTIADEIFGGTNRRRGSEGEVLLVIGGVRIFSTTIQSVLPFDSWVSTGSVVKTTTITTTGFATVIGCYGLGYFESFGLCLSGGGRDDLIMC